MYVQNYVVYTCMCKSMSYTDVCAKVCHIHMYVQNYICAKYIDRLWKVLYVICVYALYIVYAYNACL